MYWPGHHLLYLKIPPISPHARFSVKYNLVYISVNYIEYNLHNLELCCVPTCLADNSSLNSLELVIYSTNHFNNFFVKYLSYPR